MSTSYHVFGLVQGLLSFERLGRPSRRLFARAGERRQRTFELQFALPSVATRNGLARPAQIGAPVILDVMESGSVMGGVLGSLFGRLLLFG